MQAIMISHLRAASSRCVSRGRNGTKMIGLSPSCGATLYIYTYVYTIYIQIYRYMLPARSLLSRCVGRSRSAAEFGQLVDESTRQSNMLRL